MNVLLLRLEAPLMSFGGVTIDNYGVIDELPSASMFTGLLANALGLKRTHTERLQALQNRIRYAVRVDRAGRRIRDFQTAQLNKDDKAWTTHGVPQKRAGGAQSYESPHLRYRDYYADASLAVALTFEPPNEEPTLEVCAAALVAPARPLFLGRKTCAPATALTFGIVNANSIVDALDPERFPLADEHDDDVALFQLAELPIQAGDVRLAGRRDWVSDAHQGIEYWRRSPWSDAR